MFARYSFRRDGSIRALRKVRFRNEIDNFIESISQMVPRWSPDVPKTDNFLRPVPKTDNFLWPTEKQEREEIFQHQRESMGMSIGIIMLFS